MARRRTLLSLALLLLPVIAGAQTADDLLLVDCKLPPKQKRVGGRVYPMASKPIRTTAVDCRIRGGEYTVYDRANYATSLKIWLAEAEKGDVEAQYHVGKIYEGGLGTAPDYAQAAQWYAKAAATGHSPSQFSLAALHEKGLGVPADRKKALELYRKAAGLPNDLAIVESSHYDALQKAAHQAESQAQEIEELHRQLEELRKQQKRDEQRERELQQQLEKSKAVHESHKQELARVKAQLRTTAPAPVAHTAKKGTLGRFFALVIGNSRYQNMAPVPTAENDARAMAALLRDSYGFDVTLLTNATQSQILSALYKLSQNLAENDNLVVFYAGHGKRDLRNRRGWWLPVDAAADQNARTNWLPNQEVSDRLALIPARHILVLADGSYVGDITRGAPHFETKGMSAAQWAKYVETTKRKKARLALSSGTDSAGQNTRFTAALIDVLKNQKGVVPASRVHREVVHKLTNDDHPAVPTFAPLQSAFHDGVDFLFERR
jgi:uncharacterized protein